MLGIHPVVVLHRVVHGLVMIALVKPHGLLVQGQRLSHRPQAAPGVPRAMAAEASTRNPEALRGEEQGHGPGGLDVATP